MTTKDTNVIAVNKPDLSSLDAKREAALQRQANASAPIMIHCQAEGKTHLVLLTASDFLEGNATRNIKDFINCYLNGYWNRNLFKWQINRKFFEALKTAENYIDFDAIEAKYGDVAKLREKRRMYAEKQKLAVELAAQSQKIADEKEIA